MTQQASSLVAVLVSNPAEWDILRHASETLTKFGIPHEQRVFAAIGASRDLEQFITDAAKRGVEVFIASAAGGSSLPLAISAHTSRPVLAVPVETPTLRGLDSLLAAAQMPAGAPVATLAIGKAGATNAALFAAAILANTRPAIREQLRTFRAEQEATILKQTLP
jgi:5-(carboxyamino)imidazole ribonucleotide mutase